MTTDTFPRVRSTVPAWFTQLSSVEIWYPSSITDSNIYCKIACCKTKICYWESHVKWPDKSKIINEASHIRRRKS
jgi:hypothetical protein